MSGVDQQVVVCHGLHTVLVVDAASWVALISMCHGLQTVGVCVVL